MKQLKIDNSLELSKNIKQKPENENDLKKFGIFRDKRYFFCYA